MNIKITLYTRKSTIIGRVFSMVFFWKEQNLVNNHKKCVSKHIGISIIGEGEEDITG